MAAGARAHSPCQPLGPDTAWVTPRMETLAGHQGRGWGVGKGPQFLEGPRKGLEGPPSPEVLWRQACSSPRPHAPFEDIPLSGFLWKR